MRILKTPLIILLLAHGNVVAQQPAPQTTMSFLPSSGNAPAWNSFTGDAASVLFIETSIRGRPVSAMVDTGATSSALDPDWIRRAGLQVDTGSVVDLSASGGAARGRPGPMVDVDVPPYSIKKLQTLAVDLRGLAGAAEHPIDMMVGMDVIGAGSLELDLGNRRWRLAPTGLTWPQAATAPLRYTADRYHSYVEIDVDGHPLKLGVDTGYTGGLMLTEKAAALTGLFDHGRATTIASQGVGGITIKRMTIPSRLRFGALILRDVLVETEEKNGLPTQWRLDGLIGADLLRHLHAAFDFPAGTFFYVPSDKVSAQQFRTTIGVQALRQGDGLSIAHVMANSPAAKAGWKAGERICAVDGTAIKDTSKSARPWSNAPPGTKVVFRMCDGKTRSLVARDFY